MAMKLLDPVIEDVAALADSFADLVLASLGTVPLEELREGLAGSYLVFLREALLLSSKV